jgi:hypothetical protein
LWRRVGWFRGSAVIGSDAFGTLVVTVGSVAAAATGGCGLLVVDSALCELCVSDVDVPLLVLFGEDELGVVLPPDVVVAAGRFPPLADSVLVGGSCPVEVDAVDELDAMEALGAIADVLASELPGASFVDEPPELPGEGSPGQ